MAARPTHPPIVAPTMAPTGVLFEGKGAADESPDEEPPAEASEDEEESELDDEEALEEWSEERDSEVVGQPTMVGEVSAQPSMGWAKACPPLVLWLKAPLAVSPFSSNLTTGTAVLTGRSL